MIYSEDMLAWQLPTWQKQAWKATVTTVYCTCTCTCLGGKFSCPGQLDDSFLGPAINFHLKKISGFCQQSEWMP